MQSSRVLLRATRAAAPQRFVAPRAIANSQFRSYATPAAPDSKPPVALYGVDGTYASALVRITLSPEIQLECVVRSCIQMAD